MKVELKMTKKTIHGINVVHVATSNLMSYVAYHCLSGSYHEDEHNQGVSHYLEHMFFKGTKKRNYSDITDDAALLGASQNAFTSNLDTCYHLTAPFEKVEGCIELLSDMMFNSTFPENEINKERSVIQAERKSGEDDPGRFFFNEFIRNTFNFQLGHRVIGTEETIDNIDQQSLDDFMSANYGSNNTLLLVMTPQTPEVVFGYCETILEGNPFEEIEVTPIKANIIPEYKDYTFHKDIQQSHLAYLFPAPPMDDENNIVHSLVASAVGSGLFSILGKRIREELGLCYHIGYYGVQQTVTEGNACIYTMLDPDKVELAKTEIAKTLNGLAETGIDEHLFNCAKAKGLASWYSNMDIPAKLSRMIAKHTMLDLPIDIEGDHKVLSELTYDEFNEYAKTYLKTIASNSAWVEMSPNA
jgi:predicted Zn-dependent peptidase